MDIAMKKLFSLFILFALIVTLFVPFTVLAAQTDQNENSISSQINCSHEGGYTRSYYYSYISLDDTYHERYRTERRTCNSCNAVYYIGSPEPLELEKHPDIFKIDKNVHVGDPSTHYYTKSRTCDKCYNKVTKKYLTGCTASRCYEIVSIDRPEIY